MAWIIHDEEKARAAGCDMEMDETIYVLSVADVAQVFNDLAEERADEKGEVVAEDPWSDLTPELRASMVTAATKNVEAYMGTGGWHDCIVDGITDTEEEAST